MTHQCVVSCRFTLRVYVSAATAILIIASQLKNLFGIAPNRTSTLFGAIYEVARLLPTANWLPFVMVRAMPHARIHACTRTVAFLLASKAQTNNTAVIDRASLLLPSSWACGSSTRTFHRLSSSLRSAYLLAGCSSSSSRASRSLARCRKGCHFRMPPP